MYDAKNVFLNLKNFNFGKKCKKFLVRGRIGTGSSDVDYRTPVPARSGVHTYRATKRETAPSAV